MTLPETWYPAEWLKSPMQWRWTIGFNGGFYTAVLDVDYAPGDWTLEQAAKVGLHCYMAIYPPLVCRSVRLELQETLMLRNVFNSRIDVPPENQGVHFGPECDDDSVPVWVTHTADTDRYARRPLYFPGSPRSWVQDGVLTDEACSAHMTVAAGTILGFGECFMPGTLRMIRYHPGEVPFTPGTPQAPRYKNVVHIRVCTQTEKPPLGAIVP